MTVAEIKKILGVHNSIKIANVCISSQQARTLLVTNTHNRPLRPADINKYKKAMEAGRWDICSSKIQWSKDGVLVDGQHRLEALADCEKNIKLMFTVEFDVPQSLHIDTGRKRTFTENAILNDLVDNDIRERQIGSNISFTSIFKKALQVTKQNRGLAEEDIIELLNIYKNDLIVCAEAGLFNNTSRKGVGTNLVKASLFVAYMHNPKYLEVLKTLASYLTTGLGGDALDPLCRPMSSVSKFLTEHVGGGYASDAAKSRYILTAADKMYKKQKSGVSPNSLMDITFKFTK